MKNTLTLLAATGITFFGGACNNVKAEDGDDYCPTKEQFETLIELSESHVINDEPVELHFTTWAPIDIDQDGQPEVILRDEENGCYTAFAMGGWEKGIDPDMGYLGFQSPDYMELRFCIGEEALVCWRVREAGDDGDYAFLKDSRVHHKMIVGSERVFDGENYLFKPVGHINGKKVPEAEAKAFKKRFDETSCSIDDLQLKWRPVVTTP